MRLWPRSLLGQMLLAVALALLVAQSISVVLQYRAAQERAADLVATTVAVRLAERVGSERIGDERPQRFERRRGRGSDRGLRRFAIIETAAPELPDAPRLPRLENAVRDSLDGQAIAVTELRAQIVETTADPLARRFLQDRPRLAARRPLPGRLAVISILPQGSAMWLQARVPVPERPDGALGAILLQTLLLYLVLIGILWLVLRRIVGPLRGLTARVEDFARSQSAAAPLEPAGPDESRRLIAAHNALESRIVALLDEKDVMLGAIGHDLKTPLAALRVRIESVENEAARAKMVASIEDIARSLDDILTLARVGRPTDAAERIELSALAAALVEEYEDMGEPVTLGETARMAAPAHATWLRRALRNLVGNGLRYAENVRLSLVREGNEAVFTVSDDGPGIPDKDMVAMLEPFRRGEMSRNRDTGGAGLGLTLARAIAQQHGGTLTLANRAATDEMPSGLDARLRIPL
ncbi:ATP-binding protein [Alteriqipengyuania flavescens]|uniref:sensor histidine kinase n=1 Tax=Alteriqipengyuania flavescens TaxID=3053610 RepID=UPI0025B2B5A4|nr:ATP-binding protein [Alteriqipengyuania flavescens]WJY19372.1 ATP-binding protein [Alteriqipengyuania flavescens]WJY25314.1 ATP-binding protein [Alteriqipengyuania flavescens]